MLTTRITEERTSQIESPRTESYEQLPTLGLKGEDLTPTKSDSCK